MQPGTRTPSSGNAGNKGTMQPGTRTPSSGNAGNKGTMHPGTRPPTITHVGGHTVSHYPGGRTVIRTHGGSTIYRGHGGVRVVHQYPGGRRVVYTGRNYGHVERTYVHGYRLRTYWEHGHYRAVVYRPYFWGGHPYYVYAPAYYYRPAYYGWAFSPWATPVVYRWGFAGDPWYGYYGSYFAPSPFYPAADLWLTDFILAENLRMAYDAQQSAGDVGPPVARMAPENSNQVQLSPEVKQMIADEVKQQLAAERAAAANPAPAGSQPTQASNAPPPALDPNHTVFVVASDLDVVAADGNECELTPGDVVNRIDDTPDNNDSVQVRVASSKQGDCAQGSKPRVAVADLEDMSNRFREQLDAGLQQLAANNGKNGLPAAPDTTTSAAPDVPTPEPDQDTYSQLQGVQKEADQAEQDVKKPPSPGQTGGGR
jgi:hypothetical protein